MTSSVLVIAVLVAQMLCSRGQAAGNRSVLPRDLPPKPTVASLVIVPPEQVVPIGGLASYRAFARFGDGSMADVTNHVTWMASSTSKTAVIGPGHVNGVELGSWQVFASAGSVTAVAELRVE